jgi:hypothetical protein
MIIVQGDNLYEVKCVFPFPPNYILKEKDIDRIKRAGGNMTLRQGNTFFVCEQVEDGEYVDVSTNQIKEVVIVSNDVPLLTSSIVT